MASEDVIELGSSDDEAEPAPKKSKPMPNAMVCIPRKIHEVTIRPSKLSAVKPVPASKGIQKTKVIPPVKGVPASKGQIPVARGISVGKSVFNSKEITIVKAVPLAKKRTTITKAPSIVSNPFAGRNMVNGKAVQKNVVKPHLKVVKPVKIQKPSTSNPKIFHVKGLDPLNINSSNSALSIKAIKIQNTKSLNNLPPSITVKKTIQSTNQPIIYMKNTSQMFNSNLESKEVDEVQTVDLDDDEGNPTQAGPAWYIRPEEQTAEPSLEEKNNAEPEQTTMVEITIEDSPIKPLNKRTCEIGAELAITIDDSPVKVSADKNASPSGSDDEETNTRVPNSKKKLEYPKEAGNEGKETVEIEIDFPYEVSLETNGNDNEKNDDNQEVSFVSVEQAPVELSKKHDSTEKDDSSKKENNSVQKNNSTVIEEKSKTPSSSVQSEFHNVYQSFIDTCLLLENSEDMKKIVERKIKAYYRQVPKEYTESEDFVDRVASKILAMKACPQRMYLYIKDIVDELNMQRKIAKTQIVNVETKKDESEQFAFGEESEYDAKRQRQIRKLEKTIKKLHRAIQKLEEQEVDFDDDDDSVYLLTERYKERMVRVYAKFCQLTNTKMPSEPRIVLDARPGQPLGPAKRLEKWINKKVPIGTPLPFPDFHDVLRCVREANEEDKLGWNEADIMEEARDLFTRCGRKLQRRRQENEWRLAASRIAMEVDPAESNEQLKCKLEENKKLAVNKETEIFNKYADRQNQLKLEAVEIGDKEAEESPVESEEEEANDESASLENKGKRKERLKRLIQEISKGPSEDKQKQLSKDDEVEMETKKSEENEESLANENTVATENKEDSENISKESKNNDDVAETLSVSSDDNDVESDIDELHLLQKLHSGNEAESSTLESSDSDSPIAVSDSIESGSDTKKQLSDVISIENSSYSESEADKVDNQEILTENVESTELIAPQNEPDIETEVPIIENDIDCSNVEETSHTNDTMDTETTTSDVKKDISKSNNNEYSEAVEDILLASSDEETVGSQEEGPSSTEGACINLKDDLISIDETVVGSVVDEPEIVVEKDTSVSIVDETKKVDEVEPSLSVVNEFEKVDKELSVIIPEKVSNVYEPSVVENSSNDDVKDDDKVAEETTTIESISIESSQEIAPSASKEESAQNDVSIQFDDTKAIDTVISMDVDEACEELETNSTVENNLTDNLLQKLSNTNL
ncbi:hypothetical protein PYW08_013906 [Mythimna loreyi]|uniref:Uncharacterized protein n=1 Tax=Mythimna loreyi TaxID=667449 RepID=A0ACC2R8L9_9NEOP|nr:hypothetical protein PYW08_013906 [Mythimna loreyi]